MLKSWLNVSKCVLLKCSLHFLLSSVFTEQPPANKCTHPLLASKQKTRERKNPIQAFPLSPNLTDALARRALMSLQSRMRNNTDFFCPGYLRLAVLRFLLLINLAYSRCRTPFVAVACTDNKSTLQRPLIVFFADADVIYGRRRRSA